MTDVVKVKCKAKAKSTGERCKRWPINGLEVCRVHGGATAAARAKGARVVAQQELERQARALGVPVSVDPGTGMLDSLASAYGTMLALQSIIADGLDDEWKESGEQRLAAAEDRVARISKMCLDANLGERRLRLLEADATDTFELLVAALRKLGLDTPDMRMAIAAELRARALRADTIDVESEEH